MDRHRHRFGDGMRRLEWARQRRELDDIRATLSAPPPLRHGPILPGPTEDERRAGLLERNIDRLERARVLSPDALCGPYVAGVRTCQLARWRDELTALGLDHADI